MEFTHRGGSPEVGGGLASQDVGYAKRGLENWRKMQTAKI